MATAPLVVRWLDLELPEIRAGAFTTAYVTVENAGSAVWRTSEGGGGLQIAYHWLDELGNPIVWDGWRTPLARPIEPRERARVPARVQAAMPPGRYTLAFDLVEEGSFWLEELGNEPLVRRVEVGPRIERRLAARGGDPDALAAQEEPLVEEHEAAAIAWLGAEAAPAPEWSARVLDAHQEGFAIVAGAIDARAGLLRRQPRDLEPWTPGRGRQPGFGHPLVCPSIVRGLGTEPSDTVAGLPAVRPPREHPWIYDGRIVVRAPSRSGRRRA